MTEYFLLLRRDIRFIEGLNACMNCGVCTAICPAAEFYNYDPRSICNILMTKDNEKIEYLLKTDTIWYCGQCLSCKTRCPRGNVPALLISALRQLSIETGLFAESEKGRQQYAVMKTVGENIINTGYCVHPALLDLKLHPEQGPVMAWYKDNAEEVADMLGAHYNKEGEGALRKISQDNLDELKSIFNITGGTELFESINKYSKAKAKEMHINCEDKIENSAYFFHVYLNNDENQ